jgi:hypothetical protein
MREIVDAADASRTSSEVTSDDAPPPQVDSLRAFFEAHGAPAGIVDLVAMPDPQPMARVGEVCALLRLLTSEARRAFDSIVIAGPPRDRPSAEAAVRAAVQNTVHELGATSVNEAWLDAAFSAVEFHWTTDLSIEALTPAISRVGPRVALIVTGAVAFRGATFRRPPGARSHR